MAVKELIRGAGIVDPGGIYNPEPGTYYPTGINPTQAQNETEAPEPRVLSMWPLDDDDEVLPEYRFAAVPVEELESFPNQIPPGFVSPGHVDMVLEEAETLVEAVDPTDPATRSHFQNVEAKLGELQNYIVAETGAIVVRLLNAAQAATSEAASAFAEIGFEVSAWPGGVPLEVQQEIRVYANAWSLVMRDTSGRYQRASRLYQAQLDRVQTLAELRTGLLAKIYESFEEQLAAQRALIDQMKEDRGLLAEATRNIQAALNAGLDAAQRALPSLQKGARRLLIAGGVVTGAILGLWGLSRLSG